jgi:hypothetical protein
MIVMQRKERRATKTDISGTDMTLQKPVSAAKEENILQTENKMLL